MNHPRNILYVRSPPRATSWKDTSLANKRRFNHGLRCDEAYRRLHTLHATKLQESHRILHHDVAPNSCTPSCLDSS